MFDQDAAIRSTGVISVNPTFTESTFEAIAIEYNAALLNWTLTEPYTEVESIPDGSSGLVGVAVVY
jgi:hypothetical protein